MVQWPPYLSGAQLGSVMVSGPLPAARLVRDLLLREDLFPHEATLGPNALFWLWRSPPNPEMNKPPISNRALYVGWTYTQASAFSPRMPAPIKLMNKDCGFRR